ncbi:MAG: radical SAM protein [Armatimonadetes bacterium]|nr:radical SAM protein [Armatimonadota bacterium]
MIIEEIRCKSLLHRCPMDFADFTLNPYEGCAFGCLYCYVPVIRVKRGQEDAVPWGQWARVKINAREVLRHELKRAPFGSRIAFGTATDSYQPLEKRYRITRGLLEELSWLPYTVSITTRSPIVLQDADLIASMSDIRINFSLPTHDDRVRKTLEPYAPSAQSRLKAIERLTAKGVAVNVFMAPLLPGAMDNESMIWRYCKAVADSGAKRVVCGSLRHLAYFRKAYQQRLESIGMGQSALTREQFPIVLRQIGESQGLCIDCYDRG